MFELDRRGREYQEKLQAFEQFATDRYHAFRRMICPTSSPRCKIQDGAGSLPISRTVPAMKSHDLHQNPMLAPVGEEQLDKIG